MAGGGDGAREEKLGKELEREGLGEKKVPPGLMGASIPLLQLTLMYST